MHNILEIIELIFIPLTVLVALSICEQWIEQLSFDERCIKSVWDTEIFCLGAQAGFVFRSIVSHPNGHAGWACLCLGVIILAIIAIGAIRKSHRYRGEDPAQNAYQNTAFCIGGTSIVIPPLYVLTS